MKLQRVNKEMAAALEMEREAGKAAVRELEAEIKERQLLEQVPCKRCAATAFRFPQGRY